MSSILQRWDTLVNATLNPLAGSSLVISDEMITSLIAQSKLEKETVKNLLIEGAIDRKKIMDKQQFIQVIQGILIRLLDRLYSYKQMEGLGNSMLCLYNTISQHLEEVLNFIEDFFSNYFDRNSKVPASYVLISIEELCRQLHQLQGILKTTEAIDNNLKNVLVNNFDAFCLVKSTGPTYNELLYQKDLMSELLSHNVFISEGSIKEILFYFNFNDDDFVAYLVDKLKALTKGFGSDKEKISALRYEQKTINQLRTKLNFYLSLNMPSLKEQVNSWIEEEIKFLQTEPSSLPLKTENEVDNKIQTSLSVSKLALLIRLMIIDKIITSRVVAQVLRVIIRTVTTPQAVNIGFSSIESKYHKPDKGTISAVKDMLFRWINILNKL